MIFVNSVHLDSSFGFLWVGRYMCMFEALGKESKEKIQMMPRPEGNKLKREMKVEDTFGVVRWAPLPNELDLNTGVTICSFTYHCEYDDWDV